MFECTTSFFNEFNSTLAGLIASPFHAVKIITRGEVSKAFTIKTQSASKSAVELIEKAGGSFEQVAVPQRQAVEEEA